MGLDIRICKERKLENKKTRKREKKNFLVFLLSSFLAFYYIEAHSNGLPLTSRAILPSSYNTAMYFP